MRRGRQYTYQGAEVATDTANLLFKDLVVEPSLELSLPSRGRGDVHSGLTTTENDILLLGRDSGAVQGSVGVVCFEDLQVASGNQLRGLVLASSDEIGAAGAPLQIRDLAAELVHFQVVDEIAVLSVVLRHRAVLVAGDDVLGQVAPAGDGGLALVTDDDEGLLGVLLGGDVEGDVEHDNVAEVAHALLGDAEQLGAVLVELDALDGGGELPRHQALAGLDLPQLDGVVGRARGEQRAGRVEVDGPDGALVAVVGADALAVVRGPKANVLVLCCGCDEVAITVVSGRRGGGLALELRLNAEEGEMGGQGFWRVLDLGESTFVP